MKEKREHSRYELPVLVKIEAVSDNNRLLEDTRLIDIGPGGACFGLKADLETGQLVGLTIPDIDDGFTTAIGLPSRSEGPLNIKLQGEVLRSEKATAEDEERRVSVRFVGPVRLSFGPETQLAGDPHDPILRENHRGEATSENQIDLRTVKSATCRSRLTMTATVPPIRRSSAAVMPTSTSTNSTSCRSAARATSRSPTTGPASVV